MAPTKTRRASSSLTETEKAQRKRVSDALYYRQNIATIREKRRVQMAEKRALKKASRRISDKPRPEKKSAQPRTTKATSRTAKSAAGSCSSLPSDSDLDRLVERSMRDAEREATETLAGMWRHRSSRSPGPHRNGDAPDPFQHWQDTVPVEDVDFSSDVESASGLRTWPRLHLKPPPTQRALHSVVNPEHNGPFNANAEFNGIHGCVRRETAWGEGTS
ncbi:hypothetical protein B0H14DRAFT_2655003 [Mycena olivaceomarginata]|nr:hypothetical protein B0H14DRAFT_2655003 [Mycena olivaceomarginata]